MLNHGCKKLSVGVLFGLNVWAIVQIVLEKEKTHVQELILTFWKKVLSVHPHIKRSYVMN